VLEQIRYIPVSNVVEELGSRKPASGELLELAAGAVDGQLRHGAQDAAVSGSIYFSSTSLWLAMSTRRRREGALAARSHEWHTRPASMRMSKRSSLAKTHDRASRGSSDQSLAGGGVAIVGSFLDI